MSSEASQPVFQIRSVYLKDMSLEQPHSPAIFLEKKLPEIEVSINVGFESLAETTYESTVKRQPIWWKANRQGFSKCAVFRRKPWIRCWPLPVRRSFIRIFAPISRIWYYGRGSRPYIWPRSISRLTIMNVSSDKRRKTVIRQRDRMRLQHKSGVRCVVKDHEYYCAGCRCMGYRDGHQSCGTTFGRAVGT